MADHEGDIYVYRGGRAPEGITHAIIDKSVNEIDDKAFYRNTNLWSVKTHDRLERIGCSAFQCCESLTEIDLRSVEIFGEDKHSGGNAFEGTGLTEVECDKLEIVGSFLLQNVII